jgi:chromosome partitioning protein
VHRSERRLVIVANRARRYTRAYASLMKFLESLRIPVAAVLRDSQAYMRSAESGMGIHEMKGALLQEDIDSWQPLVDWLDGRARPVPQFELVPPPSGAEEGDDPPSAAFSGT